MSNNRVHYPIQYIALGEYSTASGIPVHGVQSVNVTTTFNLEQVFELGQLDIYENIDALPDVEITAEKVLDGYPVMYHLSTRGATSPTLLARSNQRADIILSIFDDDFDNSSGTPRTQAYCSGMFINSLNYNLPVQGNSTESVTWVGNDKVWKTSNFFFDGHFDGTDSPASGVQRRENVIMGSGQSAFPRDIQGITSVGPSGFNIKTNGVFGAHIQDVAISTTLGREDLFELGRRKPYYRFANFPTAVDCSINVTAGGDEPGDLVSADSEAESNLNNEIIKIKLSDGTIFDLGTKNKLQSVTYSGGNTDGGVVSLVYNYQNFNILTVTSPSDPEGLT